MKTTLIFAAAIAMCATSAQAQVRYDRKLEAAIMAKVAESIGDIRGSFEYGANTAFVQPDPLAVNEEQPFPEQSSLIDTSTQSDGTLTLAVEHRSVGSIF